MSCVALCGPLCDVLVAGSIEEILPDDKTALRTCKWPLRRICFWGLSALLDVDAKMSLAGRRTAHKRRIMGGEYSRDIAAHRWTAWRAKESPP